MPFNDWEPLAPPASPSAEDDEFADASGGVPGGWTETDLGGVATITEDRQGLAITMPANAVQDYAGIFKTIPAGDGTWWTRLSLSANRANTNRLGIALFESALGVGGDIALFYLRTNSTDQALVYGTLTAYNATASVVTTHALSTDTSVTHIWLRVRRTGTTYAMDYSTDGIGWKLLRSGSLAITPAHIGILMDVPSSGDTSVGRASFWRYVASDVGITGLASGDRISYDMRGTGAPSLAELTASGDAGVPEFASGDVMLEELYGGGTDFPVVGSGDVSLSELTVAGSAFHEQTSSGAVSLGELTAIGDVLQTQTVVGNSFLPQLVAEGVAGRVVIGTGDVNLGELTASGTQGTVGAATLGGLTASGSALASAPPPVGGDTSPPATPGVGNMGGADICLDVDMSLEDVEAGTAQMVPVAPVRVRYKRRRRLLSQTPSGYTRATTLPGRELVVQWGDVYLPVEDMAALRAMFANRVNFVRYREPDGTLVRMRCRRDSFKTRWSWSAPGFYDPLILTFTELP